MDLLKKINDKLIVIFALALAVFQIYTAAVQFFPAMTQRSIHLGFGLAMIFLMYSKKKEGKGWITTAIYIINICLSTVHSIFQYLRFLLHSVWQCSLSFVSSVVCPVSFWRSCSASSAYFR